MPEPRVDKPHRKKDKKKRRDSAKAAGASRRHDDTGDAVPKAARAPGPKPPKKGGEKAPKKKEKKGKNDEKAQKAHRAQADAADERQPAADAKTERKPTKKDAPKGKGKKKKDDERKSDEQTSRATLDELMAALDENDDDLRSAGEPAEAVQPSEDEDDDGEIRLSDTLPMEADDDLSEVEGEASRRLMSIIESLLFAATRPLTVKDIRRLLKEPSKRQIQLALKALVRETAERGIVVGQVAGGFRLRTHAENAQYVQKLLAGKPARLSRSQLESLAVIAYQQPITKAEIDHVRGVDCSAVLRLLLERDLVKIVGRKEEPGRPHVYGTTVKFLEFFNLRSLRDMPDLHEFRELTVESQATLREQLGDSVSDEQEDMGQEVLTFDDSDAGEARREESYGEDAGTDETADEEIAANGEARRADSDDAQDVAGTSPGAELPDEEIEANGDAGEADQDSNDAQDLADGSPGAELADELVRGIAEMSDRQDVVEAVDEDLGEP